MITIKISKIWFGAMVVGLFFGQTALAAVPVKPVAKFTCGQAISYLGGRYDSVQIGPQCWLKQNLNVGNYVSGKVKPTNNKKIEKFCYNNDQKNCLKYGALYTYGEATQYNVNEGAQGICPAGWHLPTKLEQGLLMKNLANRKQWESKFNNLYSGVRLSNGSFGYLGQVRRFWSSTAYDSFFSWLIDLGANTDKVYQYYSPGTYGFSVKCLKNISL